MKSRLLFIIIFFSSCTTEVWYKTKTGLLYRVVKSSGKDSVARMGQTVKLEITQKVRDSIMQTTSDTMPVYYMVMPGMHYYNPLEVFDYGMHKGDSIVTMQTVDSMLHKKIFARIPRWMKPSDKWITTIKVEDIFTADSAVQADKAVEAKRIVAEEEERGKKRIEAWLGKRSNIFRSGNTFVEITSAGNGPVSGSGKAVTIDFILTTLTGIPISNTADISIHPNGPRTLTFGKGTLPRDVENVLESQSQGARVRFMMPAVHLFGIRTPAGVKVNDDLVLTVIIRKVA